MRSFVAHILLLFPSILTSELSAQASFAALATTYSQDFNSLPNVTDGSPLATWANNTTLTGWYIDETAGAADDLPVIEATYTTMQNTGSSYIYASGTDRSLGTRPAGSTNAIQIGVRLKNNTGSTITSVYVDYYGEQWTIAENGVNVNTNAFSYQTGTTVTSLTTGSWTNVTALDFTQIYTSSQSSGLGGSACAGSSNQCLALDGNASVNRTHITGCITVTINPGDEIMFRWTDLDNASNDPHLQYDDVQITPFNVSCATVLPVELLSFSGRKEGQTIRLDWSTASERNNDHFTIDKMLPGGEIERLAAVNGNGTTNFRSDYSLIDQQPNAGYNYYRLTQTDFNGVSKTYPWITVDFNLDYASVSAQVWNCGNGFCYAISGWHAEVRMTVYDITGRIISEETLKGASHSSATLSNSISGLLLIEFTDGNTVITRKLVL